MVINHKYSVKKAILDSSKVVLASVLAILIAQFLKLEFAISAGIVAILSVAPTKKETLQSALSRFLAFVVALIIAFFCYNIIGYTVYSYLVYLLLFIFICHLFGWNNAMAMDSVLVSHFLMMGNMSMSSLANELLLFVIGVTFGIIVNLHLHKDYKRIELLKDNIDSGIRLILLRMSQRILNKELESYDGTCFEELLETVYEAEKVAHSNYLNEIISNKKDKEYISMRRRQISVLWEMYKTVKDINSSTNTANEISSFFAKVSESYSRDNKAQELIEELDVIISNMKKYDLPVSRDEFENRAKLFCLLNNLHEFLEIKRDYCK